MKPTQTTQSRLAIPPVASISAIAASKEPAVWRRKRLIIVTAVAATVIVLLAITGLLTRPHLSVGLSVANDYAEAMKLATGLGGTRIDLPKAAEYLQRAAAIIRAGIEISANNDRHFTNFRVQVFHRGLMGEKLTLCIFSFCKIIW